MVARSEGAYPEIDRTSTEILKSPASFTHNLLIHQGYIEKPTPQVIHPQDLLLQPVMCQITTILCSDPIL